VAQIYPNLNNFSSLQVQLSPFILHIGAFEVFSFANLAFPAHLRQTPGGKWNINIHNQVLLQQRRRLRAAINTYLQPN